MACKVMCGLQEVVLMTASSSVIVLLVSSYVVSVHTILRLKKLHLRAPPPLLVHE